METCELVVDISCLNAQTHPLFIYQPRRTRDSEAGCLDVLPWLPRGPFRVLSLAQLTAALAKDTERSALLGEREEFQERCAPDCGGLDMQDSYCRAYCVVQRIRSNATLSNDYISNANLLYALYQLRCLLQYNFLWHIKIRFHQPCAEDNSANAQASRRVTFDIHQ